MNLYAYAGNNPISYDDPFGLWDPAAHKKILQHALGRIATKGQLQQFNSASITQDVLHDRDNQRHYLADPGQDPAAAKARAEAYIASEIKTARADHLAGNDDAAALHLGNALHDIADGTSPAHVDANGMPKEYPGPQDYQHSMCDHCGGFERSQDITKSVYEQNDQRMQAAYNQVYGKGN